MIKRSIIKSHPRRIILENIFIFFFSYRCTFASFFFVFFSSSSHTVSEHLLLILILYFSPFSHLITKFFFIKRECIYHSLLYVFAVLFFFSTYNFFKIFYPYLSQFRIVSTRCAMVSVVQSLKHLCIVVCT